jgi:uncharacterized membrane protein
MHVPGWALLASFWLHMLATVLWLGGLAIFSLIILPSVRQTLKAGDFRGWFAVMNRRLDSIGWFSVGLLTFTGLVQMDANPNYLGLFDISNQWGQAICLKHIAFGGMIGVSAYITWGVSPALARATLIKQGVAERRHEVHLQRLTAVNLILGVAVLVFTALARIQ